MVNFRGLLGSGVPFVHLGEMAQALEMCEALAAEATQPAGISVGQAQVRAILCQTFLPTPSETRTTSNRNLSARSTVVIRQCFVVASTPVVFVLSDWFHVLFLVHF